MVTFFGTQFWSQVNLKTSNEHCLKMFDHYKLFQLYQQKVHLRNLVVKNKCVENGHSSLKNLRHKSNDNLAIFLSIKEKGWEGAVGKNLREKKLAFKKTQSIKTRMRNSIISFYFAQYFSVMVSLLKFVVIA